MEGIGRTAMLKGSGENTDMYMWHCCMLMHGHAWTTLSCQSHDMLNLCVPESRGQVLGMRLISMLHVNSRLWTPNPSKMRMEKGHSMMNLPLQLTIHNWMMTIRKTSRLITSLQSPAGIAGMICTCKHVFFLWIKIFISITKEGKGNVAKHVLLVFVRTAVNVASA